MLEERRRPIQEFDVRIKDAFAADLVGLLKEPTRTGADLHLLVGPRIWYGNHFQGAKFEGSDWEKFKANYQDHLDKNHGLRNAYSIVGKNWEPIPIDSDEEVHRTLRRLSGQLTPAIDWGRDHAHNNKQKAIVAHLETAADYLDQGRFDEVMMSWVKLPPDSPVNWVVLPVEYHCDPLEQRASFQGLLTVPDISQTRKANKDIEKFNKAAMERYGKLPHPSKVIVGNVIMLSGYLGESENSITAFNVPNNPAVGEAAGNNLIYLLAGRMSDKNDRILSPKLERVFGISSSFYDIRDFTTGHEYAHGYRYEGEDERWGEWRLAGRELWATDRDDVLAARREFTEKFLRRVLRGTITYANFDIDNDDLQTRVFEPLGENQPTLEELKKRVGGYGVGGYIILRRGILDNCLAKSPDGKPRMNITGMVKLAEERDAELDRIAKGGNPEEAEKFFKDQLDTRKIHPVNVDLSNDASDDDPEPEPIAV